MRKQSKDKKEGGGVETKEGEGCEVSKSEESGEAVKEMRKRKV